MVVNFDGVVSLLDNLNLSLNREIARINSDMAESNKEILTIAIIVWAFSIKLMKDDQLLGINVIEPPL